MAFSPTPTNGLGVAAKVVVPGNESPVSTKPGYNQVTLSLSGTGFPATFQLDPTLEDASGNEITPGTVYTLSAAAINGVFTGTGLPASNTLVGKSLVTAGFTNAANNTAGIITANTTTSVTIDSTTTVAETHAATGTVQETGSNGFTYFVDGASSLTSGTAGELPAGSTEPVVTVSATGLLTPHVAGGSTVEVSYPAFNAAGTIVVAGKTLPSNKVYADVAVNVVP
jgi:cell wall-associated NlpC family hydrolase